MAKKPAAAPKAEEVKKVGVIVDKAFTLNIGGELTHYRVGVHSVTPEVADHWYTQLHLRQSEDEEVAEEGEEVEVEETEVDTDKD